MPFEDQQFILEDAEAMWFPIEKLSLISDIVVDSEKPLAMPLAFEPLTFIQNLSFFNTHALNVIINPVTLIDSAISIVIDALSPFVSFSHLALVPFPVFPNVDALPRVAVSLPFA